MTQYLHPAGLGWVTAAKARRDLMQLAGRLDAVEQHARAHYVRTQWQTVAARPAHWADLTEFAARLEEEQP